MPPATFQPLRWLGAPAPGALMLPEALPTPRNLYAPRGVWLDDEHLIVADTGNHRLLVWPAEVASDHADAALVLGQPHFGSEGPNAAGAGAENGLHLPTGILVHEGRLLVADAWNHRILIWDEFPRASNTPPSRCLGQPDLRQTLANRGADRPGPLTLDTPYGLAFAHGWFLVCDTSNRRVLGWRGVPECADQPPDLLLGQPHFGAREENRGGETGPMSFRWPHALAASATHLYIADAGNHRILGWRLPLECERPADLVLGQSDFTDTREWPYGPHDARKLRFPYGLTILGDALALGDTANNRVLLWEHAPQESGVPAEQVLGQPDFTKNGENRWKSIERDTLCWPYGLHRHGDRLAIADSGNNRVMIWQAGDEKMPPAQV